MGSLPKLEQGLLEAIRAKVWRGEASLCRQFDRKWRDHTEPRYSHIVGGKWRDAYGPARSPEVEDALFRLVRAGKIEWFGGGDQGAEPLKYRAVRRG